VSRAHIIEVIDRKEGEDSFALSYIEVQFSDCKGMNDCNSQGIYIDIDLLTLQKIIASIAI
jgi:hypothetical protein